MKKLISLFLAVIMIFSLTACSDFPRSVEDLNESQVPDELKVSQKQTHEAGEAKLNLYYDMNLILACNYPGFNSDLDKLVIEEINNIRGAFIELVKEFKAKRFKKGLLENDIEIITINDIEKKIDVEENGKNALYNGETGEKYPVDELVINTNIRNSSKIIMMWGQNETIRKI